MSLYLRLAIGYLGSKTCQLGQWFLRRAADAGVQVSVLVAVTEAPGEDPVIYHDEEALTEAVMSRLPIRDRRPN